jgi:hypothetical protein
MDAWEFRDSSRYLLDTGFLMDALVATAHYLARVMLAMLKRGEFWQEELTMAA